MPDTWAYPGWAKRWPLDIDGTVAALSGAVSGAIAIPGVPAALKAVCQAAGQDLRFALADGTPLTYAIESWSAAEPVVHVGQYTQAAATTRIYAYGGNPAALDAQDKAAVAAGYAGYWPLGDAGPTTAEDWTSNANHGTQSGAVTFGAAGKANGACSFDGGDDWLGPGARVLTDTTALTTSAWIYYRTHGDYRGWCSQWKSGTLNGYANYITTGIRRYVCQLGNNAGATQTATTSSAIPTAQWVHLAATWESGGAVRVYLNGAQDGLSSGTLGGNLPCSMNTVLGALQWNSGVTAPEYFSDAVVDNIAVAASALPPDAIAFIAKSFPGSAMFTFGPLESAPAGGGAWWHRTFIRQPRMGVR